MTMLFELWPLPVRERYLAIVRELADDSGELASESHEVLLRMATSCDLAGQPPDEVASFLGQVLGEVGVAVRPSLGEPSPAPGHDAAQAAIEETNALAWRVRDMTTQTLALAQEAIAEANAHAADAWASARRAEDNEKEAIATAKEAFELLTTALARATELEALVEAYRLRVAELEAGENGNRP